MNLNHLPLHFPGIINVYYYKQIKKLRVMRDVSHSQRQIPKYHVFIEYLVSTNVINY